MGVARCFLGDWSLGIGGMGVYRKEYSTPSNVARALEIFERECSLDDVLRLYEEKLVCRNLLEHLGVGPCRHNLLHVPERAEERCI